MISHNKGEKVVLFESTDSKTDSRSLKNINLNNFKTTFKFHFFSLKNTEIYFLKVHLTRKEVYFKLVKNK